MSDSAIAGMVQSVEENQKQACSELSQLLANAGSRMNSNALEAIAQAVTLMASARRTLEQLAQAVAQETAQQAQAQVTPAPAVQ